MDLNRVVSSVLCLAAIAAACGKSPTSPAPAPSPGGTQTTVVTTPFAFVSNRDGTSAIYVTEGEGSEPRRLTEGIHPDWSADDRIAYQYSGGGGKASGIYVMPAFGGGERFVGPGENPSWSPDSRFIAVTRNDVPYDPNALWILDAEGTSAPRQIPPKVWTNPSLKGWVWAGGAIDPAWSPDGRYIVFSGCSSAGHPWDWGQTCGRLWGVAIEGNQAEAELTDRGIAMMPAWSGDGKLAFQWDGTIATRSASGAGGSNSFGQYPDWTPDGRLIFATQLQGATGLRLAVLENGKPRLIVPDATGARASYADWQVTARPR